MLEAAALLQEGGKNQFRFVLIGDGLEKPNLIRQAQELKLSNVEFRPMVPKPLIPKVMEDADALINVFRDLPVLRFGTSSLKIFDYLASGRPILNAVAGRNNPVSEADAGITVLPENPVALAQAVEKMADLAPEERVQMGRNGYTYVKTNHDTRKLAAALEQILNPMS